MLEDLFLLSRHFLRSFDRPYRRYLLGKRPFETRFSMLIGPRGAGKTTALIQYALDCYGDDPATEKALYLPVDHFTRGNRSLYEIAEEFHSFGGELVCFDEIHKYGNWSGELKSIYDSFPKLRMIASGSSALEIGQGSHDLSRRAIVYRLNGLSFREYMDLVLERHTEPLDVETILEEHEKLAGVLIEGVEKSGRKILALFGDYLRAGYFPYFREFDDASLYHIALEQGIHTTIESDLLAVYPSLTGSSVKKLKQLLAVIAESVPFTPDMRRLKRLVDVGDERTLKSYLKYLEDGGIIINLSAEGRGLKGMEKPEKIYLNNPNQVYAISGEGRENIGNIRETFFVNMMSVDHEVTAARSGDFWVDSRYTFEVGGRNKDFGQIRDEPDSFLAVDGIERGIGRRIPLWLFGFVY